MHNNIYVRPESHFELRLNASAGGKNDEKAYARIWPLRKRQKVMKKCIYECKKGIHPVHLCHFNAPEIDQTKQHPSAHTNAFFRSHNLNTGKQINNSNNTTLHLITLRRCQTRESSRVLFNRR